VKKSIKKSKPGHKSKLIALSIRQPYVEQIFRKTKKSEYRKQPTKKIGETVYIYASLTPGDEEGFRKLRVAPGDLPVGRILGTVEISGCRKRQRYSGEYKWEWILVKPKRLKRPIEPKRHPQPAWFYPY